MVYSSFIKFEIITCTSLKINIYFAVILGNAYMSLFFAVGQASQALDQCMKAYAQAVSVVYDVSLH